MIAFFNSEIPETGVYLFLFSSIAFFPASLISLLRTNPGSPTLKSTTSNPSFLNSFAFAEILRVAEGSTFDSLLDSVFILIPPS